MVVALTILGARHWVVTPQIKGGNLYITSRGGSVCSLNATNGHLNWSRPIGGIPSLSAAGGTVYVSSYKGTVTALRAVDGSRRWTFRAGESVEASPAIAGSAVHFGSGNQV
jgi:outer membrane protein assembly factor BamB